MTIIVDENTLANLYRHTAKTVKRRKMLLIGPRSLTYGQTLDEIGRLMRLFVDSGLKKGDSIVLSVEEDAASIPLFLAAFRYGLTITPIDIAATSHEAKAMFSLLDAKAVICSKHVHELWQSADVYSNLDLKLQSYVDLDATKPLITKLFKREDKSSDETIKTFPAIIQSCEPLESPPDEPCLSDGAVMFFTSGTTGKPKLVRLSYRAVLSQADVMARKTGISDNSVLMTFFKFSQVGGVVSGILLSFWNGITICRPALQFSYNEIPLLMDSIYKKRVTHFYLVPSIIGLLLRYGGDLKQVFDTGDFQSFMCMAAYLPESLWKEFEAATGKVVINSYGLTEANNLTYSGPMDSSRDLTSVGRPVGCEIKVICPDGKTLATGEKGELLIKGPTVMSEYYRNPQVTATVLKDGWFHTGDLGKLDNDGYCYITGRIKDIIISGGYNIYPEEINVTLLEHPHVTEAYTLGVKSEILGEEAISCVVADEGQTDEQDLIGHLRSHLSQYKIPKRILFLDELPLTPRRKVDRIKIEHLVSSSISSANPLNDADIRKQVVEAAAQTFFVEESELQTGSSYNNTPGWDSLGHLQFIDSLESRFSIKLEPMEILRVQTIGDAIKMVEEKHGTAE